MQQDNVNDGSVQNTETPEVKNENEVVESTVESTTVVETVEATITDPDEKIINDFYESGKTEVTLNDLAVAGFDTLRTSEYAFEIGSFKLTKLFIAKPYKIEKIK